VVTTDVEAFLSMLLHLEQYHILYDSVLFSRPYHNPKTPLVDEYQSL
jgi:hypothetical protein